VLASVDGNGTRAAEISGIPLVTETDAEEVERVFAGAASA